jgi:hypothetical protein
MSGQSFEPVAIRLLGFYALIKALGLFSYLATIGLLGSAIISGHGWATVAFLLLPFALLLALAYTFTAHPMLVAEKLLYRHHPAPLPTPLINVAFIVAGAIILGDALPDLTRLLRPYSDVRPEFVVGTTAQVLLGLLALLKPESMAGPLMTRRVRPQKANLESDVLTQDKEQEVPAGYPSNDLGALALAVVGIVLFGSALPFLVPAVLSYFVNGAHSMDPTILGTLYMAAPKAILGLVLFSRPREIMMVLGKRLFLQV